MGSRSTRCIFRWTDRRCWLEPASGCDQTDRRWILEFNEYFESEPPGVRQWFFVLNTWRAHTFIIVEKREGI
jgi:hypothetical protein